MPDPTPRLHLLAHDADRLLRCLLAPDGGAALQVFRLGDVGAEVCLTATDVDAFLRVLRPARLIQVLVERQQVHLLEQALADAETQEEADNPFFDQDTTPANDPDAWPVWHFRSAPGRRACGEDMPNAWSTDREREVTCPRCLGAMSGSGPSQDCLTTGTCQGTCTGPLECGSVHKPPAEAAAALCRYCTLPRAAHVPRGPSGHEVWWCTESSAARFPYVQYSPVSPREEQTHE